jgi:hypothetical protein
MPITQTTGLQDPAGTISKSGRSAAGSASEIDLVAAITVPTGDEHHLCELNANVNKGASNTIYRVYGRASSADAWTQVYEMEVGDYGIVGQTLGTSIKIPSGNQWKVTVQQATIGRCAIRVGGVAKKSDVRDY